MTANIENPAGIEWAHFEGAVGFAGSIGGEDVIGSIEWRNLEGAPGENRIGLDSAVFVHGPQEGGDTSPVLVDMDFAARLADRDPEASAAFLGMIRDKCNGLAVKNIRVRESRRA